MTTWHDDSAVTLEDLCEAYRELDATKPLRDLGRSVSFVNHEIKNCISVISGCAMLVRRSKNLDDRDRTMIDSILEAAAKIQDLSTELSAMKSAPRNSGDFDLTQMLNLCIERYFGEHTSKFAIHNSAIHDAFLVSGNPEKLERVFMHLFRNALEAGAQKINIALSVHNYVALVVVEDDGAGCSAAHLGMMSETFFTTKSRHNGIGIGLCIIRSVVEANYGSTNIYSKNLSGEGGHGLSVQITIPSSKQMPHAETKSEVMVVEDGFDEDEYAAIFTTLKNLKIVPHTAETPQDVDFDSRSDVLALTVFAKAPQAAELWEKAKNNPNVKVLAIQRDDDSGVLFAVNKNNSRAGIFAEDFVMSICI